VIVLVPFRKISDSSQRMWSISNRECSLDEECKACRVCRAYGTLLSVSGFR